MRRSNPASSTGEHPGADDGGKGRKPLSRVVGVHALGGDVDGVYSSHMPIRVVIADDNLIAREGVQQLLMSEPDVDVRATYGGVDDLLNGLDEDRPDVVISDMRMPPTQTDEGIQVAARLRETHPELGVVILSQYDEPAFALALLEHGSDRRGYLLKERVHDRTHLRAAIEAVAAGGTVIDPKLVDALVTAKMRPSRSPIAALTPREREVLAEIAQGKSNMAIAASLVLTKRAVEKHINSIFLKLGLALSHDVSKRVKAMLMYLADADG
jgi:DNA-binding NarL/FixJ family response regulator